MIFNGGKLTRLKAETSSKYGIQETIYKST